MSNNIRPGAKLINMLCGIIAANPGISSLAISEQSGYSFSHTKRSLCELSRAGLVSPVRMSGKLGAGWFEASKAEDARKKYARSTAKVIREALEVISLKPGASARSIAASIGRSLSYTAWALTVLSTQGVAKPVRIGNRMDGWFTAELAAGMNESAKKLRDDRDAKRAERKANPPITKMSLVVAMSKEEGGASSARVLREIGGNEKSLSAYFYKLVLRGRVFKGERKGCRCRWFDTPARAAEWSAMPAMQPSEWSAPGYKAWEDHPARKRRMVEIGERIKSSARQPSKAPPLMKGSRANKPGAEQLPTEKPSKPAGVHIVDRSVSFRDRKADYSGAKITRIDGPKFDTRYQVDPESVPRFRYGAQA